MLCTFPAFGTDDPSAFDRALDSARSGTQPLHLKVDCVDDRGARNLEVFDNGVAIWDQRSQWMLAEADRAALLQILIDQRFSTFEAAYGETKKADKQEAPIVVSCQVNVQIGDQQKRSIQHAFGERSEALANLATSLLDHVAAVAAREGIGAADLDDGLDKLAGGVLAVETVTLRFVELPAKRHGGDGTILQIERGVATVRAYTPGRAIGDPVEIALDGERYDRLIAALNAANFEPLPRNLWSDEHLEIDV